MAEENGTTLGKAYVQIMPSAKGIKSQLEELLGDNMPDGKKAGSSLGKNLVSGFGSVVKSGLATAAKAGLATIATASAGISAIVKQSVSAYADYEQNIGGIETLFKENADTVVKYASEAYKTAGISANEYMENVTSFSASLLQGLGGDTEKAAETANQAMIDMSDNANKFGTDIENIQNAYQGFAKQNYTMLDNLKLGYGGTAEEMARLVNDSGVLADGIVVDAETIKNVSFDQIIEAIHAVQEDLGVTGTTAEEASTTISGSLGSMKSAWSNLLAGMSTSNADLDSLIDNLTDTVKDFGKNILPVIKRALSGVTQLVAELAPEIAAEIPSLVNGLLPLIINAGTQVFQSLVTGITDNIDSLTQTAVTGLTTIATALITNTGPLVQALATIVTTLAKSLPEILPTLLSAIGDQVPVILQAVLDCLPAITEVAFEIITAIAQTLADNIDLIIEGAVQIIDTLAMSLSDSDTMSKLTQCALEIIAKLSIELIKNLPDILASGILIAVELIKGVANGVVEYLSPISDALSDMIMNINDWFHNKWADFKEWGSDMIDNFIEGIKSKWNDLKESVIGIGETIKDYIGFSEPEKGPLSKFHTFAPDMMDLFAEGIRDNEDTITMQFNKSLEPIMNTDIIPQGAASMPAEYANSDSATLERIIGLLETFFPQLAEKSGNVYLDSDLLTTKITPKIDTELGKRVTNSGRRLASV